MLRWPQSLAGFRRRSCVPYLIGSLGGARRTMPVWGQQRLVLSPFCTPRWSWTSGSISRRSRSPADGGQILSIAPLADTLVNVGFGKPVVDMVGHAVSIRVPPLSALAFFIVFMLFTKFCKADDEIEIVKASEVDYVIIVSESIWRATNIAGGIADLTGNCC